MKKCEKVYSGFPILLLKLRESINARMFFIAEIPFLP